MWTDTDELREYLARYEHCRQRVLDLGGRLQPEVELEQRLAAVEAERDALRRVVEAADLRLCKACEGEGDQKMEWRGDKPSRNNCRKCRGFGYWMAGNRVKFRTALAALEEVTP